MNDSDFLTHVTERLASLSMVAAVMLGGSRSVGTQRPDSDWDFAVYYRGAFNPQEIRELGWKGEVSALGGWGGGVFNGGAWLQVDGRSVDIHYRDLESIDYEMREAAAGRFRIEPLMFHLAGIPTYLVIAELALGRMLVGALPHPAYPARLRERAPKVWWERADRLFAYAKTNYAAQSQFAPCVGMVVQASCNAAHGVLADRGEWVTNEKSLLARANLVKLDQIISAAQPSAAKLEEMVNQARELCSAAFTISE
ncbi:MAG: nucleotidyltransferase domain-containing protein [Acidimicrobiales bacterium]